MSFANNFHMDFHLCLGPMSLATTVEKQFERSLCVIWRYMGCVSFDIIQQQYMNAHSWIITYFPSWFSLSLLLLCKILAFTLKHWTFSFDNFMFFNTQQWTYKFTKIHWQWQNQRQQQRRWDQIIYSEGKGKRKVNTW